MTNPCGSLGTALSQATSGSTVLLAPGSYPSQVIAARPAANSFAQNVTIRPATGGVTLAGVKIWMSHVTLQDVTSTGIVYLGSSSDYANVQDLLIEGSGMFIHSSHVHLTDSLFENGKDIDGLQVAGAPNTDITVSGNTIRGYVQTGSAVHVDCMQIFDVNNVTISGNNFGDCHNAGLIFSPGRHYGISDVLVQSNFLQGCVVGGPVPCGASTALDVRNGQNVMINHNTIATGAARINPNPGVVASDNIIDYLAQCNSPVTDSLVGRWPTWICKTLPAQGTSRQGVPTYVNPAMSDFPTWSPRARRRWAP